MGTNKTFFSAIDVLAGSHESRVNNAFLLITMLIKILELLTFLIVAVGGAVQGSPLASVEVSEPVFFTHKHN
jgi:hypothetical protein